MRISDWSSDVCSSDLPRKAEATELQGVALPGCRSARGADCSKVLGIEAIVSHHRRLAVGQRNQCGPLPPGHRNPCGHVSTDERRVGKVGVRTCSSRCSPNHYNKNYYKMKDNN